MKIYIYIQYIGYIIIFSFIHLYIIFILYLFSYIFFFHNWQGVQKREKLCEGDKDQIKLICNLIHLVRILIVHSRSEQCPLLPLFSQYKLKLHFTHRSDSLLDDSRLKNSETKITP